MDKLGKSRQLLSTEILHNFIGRITGAGLDRIVGSNPENVLLVGKLMSTNDEGGNNANSSKTFIESIGIDFYISETEIETALIKLTPQGDFYYRAVPTLKEQQLAMLKEINEVKASIVFNTFEEVMEAYDKDSEVFSDVQIKVIPVYKKVSLSAEGAQISFRPKELLNQSGDCGFVDENHVINIQLDTYVQDLQTQINEDEEVMTRAISEPVKVEHLLNQNVYNLFFERYSNKKVEQQHQNWRVYFDIQIKKIGHNYLISCFLVNDSTVLYSKSHRSRKKNKFTIETLFNSGIKVELEGADYCKIELDFFADDYKYDKSQYALSNNCAVEYIEEENALQTNHLPLYEQYRLITNDSMAVKFLDLVDEPVETLATIHSKMKKELESWKNYKSQKESDLTTIGLEKMSTEIRGFEDEISNFEHGINVIKNYPLVRKSFTQMNRAFSETSKKYSTWRLFQIVFIVSMIPDIVACDRDVMPDDEKAKSHLSSMALLYFPTGGGKTEAFLGVLVFNLFFDRYRGKKCGVTSILRYPLRLLSVQQVQRLANVMAQAELIRRNDDDIENSEFFSLGYFVGDNNTPNSMSAKEYARYREMTQGQRDEHRILEVCPFCGKQTVHLRADETLGRLLHYCENQECQSGEDLPLYIVDSEIYRYLPSAIISTVDKLALIGCNANFRSILNGANYRCPTHGYTSKNKCLEYTCKTEVQKFELVEMYDPAPTLFIQDELHLIRESLGTYSAHYESFIKYYIKNISRSKRDIKVIGATATISSYREQVYHLYGRNPVRFPCESPFIDRNFYASIDNEDLQRQILGYAPYGKAIVQSVVFSLKYMREAVYEYFEDPEKVLKINNIGIKTREEALELLKDYWIFLEYNNVKRDGNNVDGAIKTPVNEELASDGIIPFKTRAMTGDESFQDVREVLAEVENNDNVYEGINLITATSMISHGVDADRFNVMFFYGIPGNMAEYIQAYSRTGRKHTSIVIDLIRPTRETDLSYLKNFLSMHEYKDLLVEPVPINRWASKAIDKTLPGIFTSLLLTSYDPELQYSTGTLFFMKNISKAIKNDLLNVETVKEQLKMAYGCWEDDGTTQDLGNQYSLKIKEFVEDLFIQIADRTWIDENIFTGFNLMGYRIMNSLRDTDSQLIIELD
jgi:hypothetical protein